MRQLLQIVLANATPWWAFTPAIQGTTGPAEQVAEVAVVTAGAAAAAEPEPSSSSATDLRERLRPIPSPWALHPGPMPICACVCPAQLQISHRNNLADRYLSKSEIIIVYMYAPYTTHLRM